MEATARLLREGVIVPEGPMAGERFLLSGMRDKDIEETAKYLDIEYDKFQLRLIFRDSTVQSSLMMERTTGPGLCLAEKRIGQYFLAVAVR